MKKEIKAVSKNREKVSFVDRMKSFFSNRYVQFFMLCIVAFVFFFNYNAVFDRKLDLNGDNIVYYSLGQALHDGKGYSDIMGWEISPHTHFPPGYPAFISLLLNFSHDGDFTFVKKVNGFLLFASIILFFFIVKRLTKGNSLIAFLSALLCCVHKDLLRWATIMMSEMLFLFLTILVIYIVFRLYRKSSFKDFSKLDFALLGVMVLGIAALYFVRTMGISLILGLAGGLFVLGAYKWFVSRRKGAEGEQDSALIKRRLYYNISLVALVLLPFFVSKVAWDIRNKSVGHEKSDYVGDFYKKGSKGEKMSSLSDWTSRVYTNTKNYVSHFISETVLTRPYDTKVPVTGADIAVGLFVIALVMLGFYRTSSDGFLVFCYLAVSFSVLLVWPEQFNSVRYYVALVPFILFLFLNGIWNLVSLACGLFKGKNRDFLEYISPAAVACLVVFAWLIPSQVEAQLPYRQYAKLSYKKGVDDVNFVNYLDAIIWCKNNLPDSSRMVCRKPEIYYINSGFKHTKSFPHYASVDTVMSYLDRVKATNLIMDNWFKHAYTTLYPAVKKYPEKFKILHKVGELDTVNKVNPVYILQYNSEWGYHGEMIDGKKEGKGRYLYNDGRKYEGNYVNDLPDGQGVLYSADGKVQFEGTWKKGSLWSGKGTVKYGVNTYSGEFQNGLPEGYGIYLDSMGRVMGKGIWHSGKLVQIK